MSKYNKMNSVYVAQWHKKNSYEYGAIYQILNIITGESYIGSTKQPLKKRWWQAVAAANQGRKDMLYENIRNYGKESFEVKELHICDGTEDILTKEQEFIDEYNPSLNKNKTKKVRNFS